MSKRKLVEDMKRDPGRFYRLPSDVVRDRRFNDSERAEILEAWARSAEGQEDEHIPELLQQVKDAQLALETRAQGLTAQR